MPPLRQATFEEFLALEVAYYPDLFVTCEESL